MWFTGLLAESEYNEITEVSSRREHFVSEADKRLISIEYDYCLVQVWVETAARKQK